MSYYDKYGRIHHKYCINGEPSSNNGWIYTAYAAKLGLAVDKEKLSKCFNECLVIGLGKDGHTHHLMRSPGKPLPPISRDEILGMAELGLLQPKHLDGWNFSPYPIPRFNPIKLAQQLWDLRPSLNRHRNYFWQNNLDQMYRFAFSVPLSDRHFILQQFGKFNLIYWAIAKIDSMIGKPSGIGYLKYGKSLEGMQEEFPEDHPLRKSLTTEHSVC